MRPFAVVCVFGAVLAAPLAVAHHSPAAYDQQAQITIAGTVTEFEWANPHAYISVQEDAPAAGAARVWLVEALAPTAMKQFGWTEDTLAEGDRVTIVANPGRNPARSVGYLQSIEKSGAVLYDFASATRPPASTPTPAFTATGLSGVWMTTFGPVLPQFLAGAATLPTTPRGAAAIQEFRDTVNPGAECIPFPAPLYMVLPGFKSVEVRDDVVIIRGEDADVARTIYMSSSDHEGATPSVQGHSIGRWDGEALVVDTTQFTEHRLGNAGGLPGGTRKHLVERFELAADQGSLAYTFTLEDPEYLTQPVTGVSRWAYRPDVTFTPMACDTDNARRFLDE